jgi:hypothetical protein
MYSYFELFKPEGVKSNNECTCKHCKAYPELYHADTYSIKPYRRLTTLEQAKHQLNNYPDAVIIEFFTPEYEGFKTHLYKNHNTGKTWGYNPIAHKWSKD